MLGQNGFCIHDHTPAAVAGGTGPEGQAGPWEDRMSSRDEELSLGEVALATLKEVRGLGARLDQALPAGRGKTEGAGLDPDLVGNLYRAYQRLASDTDKLRRRLEAVETRLGMDPDAELAAALRRLDAGTKDQP